MRAQDEDQHDRAARGPARGAPQLPARELGTLERELTEPSLAEALRRLDSPRFADVTEAHVRAVGERFFERARSRCPEIGATGRPERLARELATGPPRADRV